MRIQPWFNTYPGHTILLSGFVSPEGSALLYDFRSCSSVPPVTAQSSSSNSLAHGVQYVMNNQWPGTSTSQLAGPDTYTPVIATVPDISPYEGPQASGPAAVQTLLHVPGAQVPAPVPRTGSPRSSGALEQQPMSHDYTGAVDATGDLANGGAGPTARRGMSGGGWTGRLHWEGVWIHARAKVTEAVRNPYAHAFVKLLLVEDLHSRRKLPEWPEDLQLEIVADPKLSIIDIQAWMRKTKASMAVLRCICETDKFEFDQLVETLRNDHSVSRPSRWLPALAVSRFDSTRLWGGRTRSDFSSRRLAKPCFVLHSLTRASRSYRSANHHHHSASRKRAPVTPASRNLKALRKRKGPHQVLGLVPLRCQCPPRDHTL